GPEDHQAEPQPEVAGQRQLAHQVALLRHVIKEHEQAAADEAANGAADHAVTELAQRAGGDALAGADGHAEQAPAEAARQHGDEEAAALDAFDHQVVGPVGDEHADRAAGGAEEEAVSAQAGEADQGAVADRLDADDEVADEAADEHAGEDVLDDLVQALDR